MNELDAGKPFEAGPIFLSILGIVVGGNYIVWAALMRPEVLPVFVRTLLSI